MAREGWTQIPNFLFDLLPKMKEAEVKVVMAVARQSVGWQRERVTLRMADLAELTGLSHPSVNTGIKAAIERGILGREADGETFTYWIKEPVCQDASVKNFNNETLIDEAESKNSLQSEVKNLNSEGVKNLNTNKRNINTNKPEKEREEEIAADAAPSAPPTSPAKAKSKRSRKSQNPPNTSEAPPREPTEWQLFLEAMCWVCYGHKQIGQLTEAQRGALTSEAKHISDNGRTIDDLRKWFATVWQPDWKWQKNRSRPGPAEVRSSLPALDSATPEGFEIVPVLNGNGNHATSKTDRKREAFANVERMLQEKGML